MNTCVIALLVGSIAFALAQSKVTVTGGPGSEDRIASGPAQVATSGGLSEEQVRQIVREELQRAGFVPGPGMNTGPFGVTPNPLFLQQTNVTALTTTGALRGVISSVATGTVLVATNRLAVPRAPATGTVVTPTTPRATGSAGPGGTAGTISGGSSGVGVATPSGAGATRPPTPTTPPAGSPGTGAAGPTGSGTGR